MKTFHVFHHDDADGYASAAVLNRFYLNNVILKGGMTTDENGDEIPAVNCCYYSCNHNRPMDLSEIENGDTVFILDYSFSRKEDQDALRKLAEKDVVVIWIDHHDTSHDIITSDDVFRGYAENGLVYTGTKHSAAMLTFIWCHCWEKEDVDFYIGSLVRSGVDPKFIALAFRLTAKEAPHWVKLVSDHDTFTHELEDSSQFCIAVTHHGLRNVFLSDDGISYSDNDHPDEDETERYILDGRLLFDYQQKQNEKLFRRAGYRVKLSLDTEYTVACFNGYGNSHVFGESFNDVDACVIFNFDGTAWRYSMFSHDTSNCDCGAIATMFGNLYCTNGGGHFHAAGWSAPVNVFAPKYSLHDARIAISVEAVEEA